MLVSIKHVIVNVVNCVAEFKVLMCKNGPSYVANVISLPCYLKHLQTVVLMKAAVCNVPPITVSF